jgi:hypothetical protein
VSSNSPSATAAHVANAIASFVLVEVGVWGIYEITTAPELSQRALVAPFSAQVLLKSSCGGNPGHNAVRQWQSVIRKQATLPFRQQEQPSAEPTNDHEDPPASIRSL